jgi:hypothetical protein
MIPLKDRRIFTVDVILFVVNMVMIFVMFASNQLTFVTLIRGGVRTEDFFIFYASCVALAFVSLLDLYTLRQRVMDHVYNADLQCRIGNMLRR